ncbi:cadherin-like protein 26 [Pholidichthys leucotaenia]
MEKASECEKCLEPASFLIDSWVYYLSCAACSELLSRQKRTWIIDTFEIEEEQPGPFPYVLGKINVEREYQVYFELFGEGVDEEPKGVISIDRESGTLSVHKAVDYEEKQVLKLRFEARKTDISIDTKLGAEISIKDINDNPPTFLRDLYEINVNEENTQGSHLFTVQAYDRDKSGTPNSTFHYEIKSVSPKVPDTEFFIDELATISFKGCLNHEEADMFTVVVEAKDHGEVISLSSSATVIIHVQDGNNHLPIISSHTGSGKVKEGETGSSPLQLHVTDEDTPNSPVWRARYTIRGDDGEHFSVETDPETNDGILTVVKPLDFEKGPQRELLISVENEVPYFSCNVREKTSSGLWKVDSRNGREPGAAEPHSVRVTIEVEDANDPPEFVVSIKEVVLEENAPAGTWLEKVTAVDPDSGHGEDLVYKVGHDPAGWATVDPRTGDITTIKPADRESPHVINGVYTILMHAVDSGNPSLTGTGTLHIHVADRNDNMPQLTENYVDVCVSDAPTTTNITAFDLDEHPFGGPFRFELLGDVRGKWKLNPAYGYTVSLVREPGVYSGKHSITVKVSDMQGEFGVHNLTVVVCDCSVTANCLSRSRSAAASAGLGAISVVVSSLFLLLFLLLLAIIMSNKTEFAAMEPEDRSEETLLQSNIEKPGADCKHLLTGATRIKPTGWMCTLGSSRHRRWLNRSLPEQVEDMNTLKFFHERNGNYRMDAALRALLHQRLVLLLETEEDLHHHEPQPYAEEGDSDKLSQLDSITIPDEDSFEQTLEDLGPKFNQLASICKPSKIKSPLQ